MKRMIFLLTALMMLADIFAQNPLISGKERVENDDYVLQIARDSSTYNFVQAKLLASSEGKWWNYKCTAEIKDSSSELKSRIWIAATRDNILFHIEVTDDINFNEQTFADDIWKDDCVQIGIDAKGQGSGEMPSETHGMVGDDDCAFGLARTDIGPIANAWFWANNKFHGKLPNNLYKISRDEKLKQTLYDVSIPWASLNTVPGLFPCFGVAIQVNDRDLKDKEQKRYFWGHGADGEPRPGLFNRLTLQNNRNKIIASALINSTLWNSNSPVKYLYTISGNEEDYVLKARFAESTVEIKIPSKQLDPARYFVLLTAKNPNLRGQLESWMTTGNKIDKVEFINSEITNPSLLLHKFISLMDSLIDIPNQHPLFVKHLISIKAMAEEEWSKIDILKLENPRLRDETFTYISKIYQGFLGESAHWKNYLNHEKSLFIAYISKIDGTLQYYMLDLPSNWDESKTYPLYFELHGAGNPAFLNIPASQLGATNEAPDLMGYSKVRSFSQDFGEGFHVAPWGRGNLSYREIGEKDVFEALDNAEKTFKINENRKYLFGFSMGGGGTWSIGLRTPDKWAAIGIYAGAINRDQNFPEKFTQNVAKLPVFIESGDKDFLYGNFQIMLKELKKSGTEIYSIVVPGMGHNFADSLQEKGLKWMSKYERKRPDKFFFIADTREHTGIWGVNMVRDERISAIPSFTCSLNNNTLVIDSEGTESLIIEPGEKGLQIKGNIKIVWNGRVAYEGPANKITLKAR